MRLRKVSRLRFFQNKIKNDKKNTFSRRIGFEKSKESVQDSGICQKIKRVGTEFLVLFFNSSSIHGLNHLTKFRRHSFEMYVRFNEVNSF